MLPKCPHSDRPEQKSKYMYLYVIIRLTIRQCAAWAFTLINQSIPERRNLRCIVFIQKKWWYVFSWLFPIFKCLPHPLWGSTTVSFLFSCIFLCLVSFFIYIFCFLYILECLSRSFRIQHDVRRRVFRCLFFSMHTNVPVWPEIQRNMTYESRCKRCLYLSSEWYLRRSVWDHSTCTYIYIQEWSTNTGTGRAECRRV